MAKSRIFQKEVEGCFGESMPNIEDIPSVKYMPSVSVMVKIWVIIPNDAH